MLSRTFTASGMCWDQGGGARQAGGIGTGLEGASIRKDLRALVFSPLNLNFLAPSLTGSS